MRDLVLTFRVEKVQEPVLPDTTLIPMYTDCFLFPSRSQVISHHVLIVSVHQAGCINQQENVLQVDSYYSVHGFNLNVYVAFRSRTTECLYNVYNSL